MPEFLDKKFKTSQEMCEDLLNSTGVVLLPGSDFGIPKDKMFARLSFTDFNGENFIKNISNNKNINLDIISKFAPKVVEGTKRLKEWVESN
jgi:aspartate aminotransferase